MAETVILPKLGLTMEEGTIVAWRRQPGEPVQKGEVLLDVETDKATVEVESQFTGVLLAVLAPAGQTVPVTAPIAYIGAPGEAAPVGEPGRLRASPSARRLARSLGLDLRQVAGTGPAGRIQLRDVQACRAARTEAAASATPATPGAPPPPPAAPAAPRAVPLAGKRKIIAERLSAAFHGAVPVTLTTTVQMSRAVELRAQLLPEVQAHAGVRLSIADVILRAAVAALAAHPALNATFDGSVIRYWPEVHAGIAVNLPDGLVVPVVRDAHRMGLADLARAARAAAERARAGQLLPDELAGGTFTVTNLGAYGIDAFNPVLNPPQAAILGIGQVAERPANAGGRLELAPTVVLSLTFDHRITDGAPAAAYLQEVRTLLEQPYRLWM